MLNISRNTTLSASSFKRIHIARLATHVRDLVASLPRHLIDHSSDDIGAKRAPYITIVKEPGPVAESFRHCQFSVTPTSFRRHSRILIIVTSSLNFQTDPHAAAMLKPYPLQEEVQQTKRRTESPGNDILMQAALESCLYLPQVVPSGLMLYFPVDPITPVDF